ncbi:hypothetical protein HN011_008618 [Eciton burchellii]|jgi:hypothetical protein|nr:hypothetical protein HN011_008618 [Eciton burchellii]
MNEKREQRGKQRRDKIQHFAGTSLKRERVPPGATMTSLALLDESRGGRRWQRGNRRCDEEDADRVSSRRNRRVGECTGEPDGIGRGEFERGRRRATLWTSVRRGQPGKRYERHRTHSRRAQRSSEEEDGACGGRGEGGREKSLRIAEG